MKDIYIGLGSNLGNPLMQIAQAQIKLAQLPNSRYVGHSKSYRTLPLGGMAQPPYINSVSYLRSSLDAVILFGKLQEIESQQGRQRNENRWQARTLDLDLLLYGDDVITSENLTVPHYALSTRNFVIFPLLELNPDISIPGIGKAADIAGSLNLDGMVPVPDKEMALASPTDLSQCDSIHSLGK